MLNFPKMDQWNKLQELGQADENVASRITLIYRQFPIEIRNMFADWIDTQQWFHFVDPVDKSVKGEALFNELIQLVNQKRDTTMSMIDKIHMKDHVQALENSYRDNAEEFVDTMQRCLSQEKLLLESYEQGTPGEADAAPCETPFETQQQEIETQMGELQRIVHDSELEVRSQEKKQEEFILRLDEITTEKSKVESELKKTSSRLQRKLQQDKERLDREKADGTKALIEKRQGLFNILCEGAMKVEQVLLLIWELLDKHHQLQKLAYTGRVRDADSSVILDILNSLCGRGSNLIISLTHQVERSSTNFINLLVSGCTATDDMRKLLSGMKQLLDAHLRRSFIIDKQPQRVLKISKGRSLSTSMSVRILGAQELGLHLHPPKVTALLYNEKDGLPEALNCTSMVELDQKKGVCEVVNGRNISMEVKKASGHLVANFNNVQLRGVKKIEKLAKEERVTEKKHGMVFFTHVTVRGDPYFLKVMSLPLVLTSQSSQECAAKGTLLWDAAFSEDPRDIYADPESVEWGQFATLLETYFRKEVGPEGPGLSGDHLQYFATRLFGGKMKDNFEKMKLSRDRVFKDKIEGREFTFWKWFFACMHLVIDNLKKEWKDGLIHGFMDKGHATNLLLGRDLGTFLLRFSERAIEQRQAATTPGCLCLAVVEIDPITKKKKVFHVKDHLSAKDIHERGLANILNAMEVLDYQHQGSKKPFLTQLEPNRPFEEVFGKYITESAGDESDGYITTKFKIEIPLAPIRSCSKPGHCSPGSPAISECHSTTTCGMPSPSVTSEAEESIDMVPVPRTVPESVVPSPYPDLLPNMTYGNHGDTSVCLPHMHSDHFGSGSSCNILEGVLDMESDWQQNCDTQNMTDNLDKQLNIRESLDLVNGTNNIESYEFVDHSGEVLGQIPQAFQNVENLTCHLEPVDRIDMFGSVNSYEGDPGESMIKSLLMSQPRYAFGNEVPAMQHEVDIPTTVTEVNESESD